MSKVVIAGDASGTGTFTISAPNGNTDRTLVLPDEAGTVLTTAGVPASAMPVGSVIQVASALSTSITINSSSYVDVTDYNVTITPSSASNKILVRVTPKNYMSLTSDTYPVLYSIILRNGVEIYGRAMYHYSQRAPNGYIEEDVNSVMEFLDSPNTTSPVTYKVQAKNAGSVNVTYYGGSVITVMEIVA